MSPTPESTEWNFADVWETVAAPQTDRVEAPWGRSGSDLVLIYTGGTTGLPRGVMWRQHDLFVASNVSGDPAQADLDRVRARLEAAASDDGPAGLPAAPLMHGTAFVFAGTVLTRGGTVVTLTRPQLEIEEMLDAIERERVTDLCIVGDAFCRPMVDALDAEPARWNIGSLKAVSSSGLGLHLRVIQSVVRDGAAEISRVLGHRGDGPAPGVDSRMAGS